MAQRIGILTGGGDCPGLNATIRAIVRRAIVAHEMECFGILRGWRGLLDGLTTPLTLDSVSGILARGGTILRTSRTNPFTSPDGASQIMGNVKRFALDGIVAVGGDDTFIVAERLYRENGLPVIGVPTTIDNDIDGTEYSFGFDSTVNIAMEAIDRIHTTAESHDRVMIIEVMGRQAGWIAVYAGLAGGADIILIPEKPLNLQEVCDSIVRRHDRGKDFSIIVVAEGVKLTGHSGEAAHVVQNHKLDEFGRAQLGGVGQALAKEVEKRTGYETRVTVLGHIQRGGSPTAFDRVLGSRLGIAAADLAHNGEFGKMVALQANKVVTLPIETGTRRKLVPDDLYEAAKAFFA